jgi:hypothetical protein
MTYISEPDSVARLMIENERIKAQNDIKRLTAKLEARLAQLDKKTVKIAALDLAANDA